MVLLDIIKKWDTLDKTSNAYHLNIYFNLHLSNCNVNKLTKNNEINNSRIFLQSVDCRVIDIRNKIFKLADKKVLNNTVCRMN